MPATTSPSSILRWILSLVIAAVFIFAGLNKLTDAIDVELHARMVAGSLAWHPLILSQLQRISPELTCSAGELLLFIGASEVAGGAALLFGGFLGTLANFGLMVVMGAAIFVHTELGEPIQNPSVILGLLVLLFIVSMSSGGSKKRHPKKKRA
eukprot:TRINITY_DN474_c0_g1_i1.p1 TRINITY_DN474_c0_g1~~TRINITY_DN474_c0_g1_i1.p1  ORF type:complete len:153 (-),score=42.99 TRINITY_DN474_c0_g1_i1:55-513(-)